ncbi:hypothetical protein KUTeg_020981 [Tegillarca granosa]|uniref:Uncharacterized protein n=1 Tax=Tegillarca granosa TaxID=220873 RepID=A0ABQ9EBW9_TEGGR|nr:hypothetical protein KUTeg_020981 [Tegillarca granosa]
MTTEQDEEAVVVPLTDTKDEGTANEEEGIHQQHGYPIDHGWAWVTVAACFGVCALVVGSMKSFGVLLVDLTRRLDAPLTPFANALSTRFSHRTVVFVGGLFIAIGMISTAFVTSVAELFVTYGVITVSSLVTSDWPDGHINLNLSSRSIGFGITLGPSLVCMGSNFNKRRAFANGLSVSGSGAGSFAIPNFIRFLVFEYGFKGCLLILGAVVLNTCVCASLFRPLNFWKKNSKI